MALNIFWTPLVVNASSEPNTIAEYKKALDELKAKKNKVDNEKKLTQQEIQAKNNAINNAHKQIEESEAKITEAKNDITANEAKIKEYETQTKELMSFYQVMDGENIYLKFIADASSMTDMIMRADAISKITGYNQTKLEELDKLIGDLQQKQVDLKNYEKELNNNITEFEKKIDELDSNLLAFDEDRVSIDEDIEMVTQKLKYLQSLGCGDNETLQTCQDNNFKKQHNCNLNESMDACYKKIEAESKKNSGSSKDYIPYAVANTTFYKPVSKGRISSDFGYRSVSGQSSNHSGIDIALTEGTPVYSMINGVVSIITRKSSCGGNKVYVEGTVNGQKYTVVYLHLLSIDSNIKVGTYVTYNTILGKSGGGSTAKRNGGYDTCTTGAHLHVSVSKGYYVNDAKYRANLIRPPGFPKKGAWFYSRTQWFD